jgi:hypothetical protein
MESMMWSAIPMSSPFMGCGDSGHVTRQPASLAVLPRANGSTAEMPQVGFSGGSPQVASRCSNSSVSELGHSSHFGARPQGGAARAPKCSDDYVEAGNGRR